MVDSIDCGHADSVLGQIFFWTDSHLFLKKAVKISSVNPDLVGQPLDGEFLKIAAPD